MTFERWRRTAELLRERPSDLWGFLKQAATRTDDSSWVWDELQRITRATELAHPELASPAHLEALRQRMREILGGDGYEF